MLWLKWEDDLLTFSQGHSQWVDIFVMFTCGSRKQHIDHTMFCSCRHHVEFDYFNNTFVHICPFLHANIVQEFSSMILLISLREFIHRIMCPRLDVQKYYGNIVYMEHALGAVDSLYCVDATMKVRIINLRGWQ